MDYLHYNPAKHGHVTQACDWPPSTCHKWMAAGVYPVDWGGSVTAEHLGYDD